MPIDGLAEAYKQVVASKYSTSALSYRIHHGLDDRETPMAVLVIEMIRPRLSGVVYTADPIGGDRDTLQVGAVRGLGDVLVGGNTSPQYAYRIEKSIFRILDTTGVDAIEPSSLRTAFHEEFLRKIWQSARQLESHFQRPLDIEWALDETGRLYLLQVRPLLVVPEHHRGNPRTHPELSRP